MNRIILFIRMTLVVKICAGCARAAITRNRLINNHDHDLYDGRNYPVNHVNPVKNLSCSDVPV
jgi:hypothetical protein